MTQKEIDRTTIVLLRNLLVSYEKALNKLKPVMNLKLRTQMELRRQQILKEILEQQLLEFNRD